MDLLSSVILYGFLFGFLSFLFLTITVYAGLSQPTSSIRKVFETLDTVFSKTIPIFLSLLIYFICYFIIFNLLNIKGIDEVDSNLISILITIYIGLVLSNFVSLLLTQNKNNIGNSVFYLKNHLNYQSKSYVIHLLISITCFIIGLLMYFFKVLFVAKENEKVIELLLIPFLFISIFTLIMSYVLYLISDRRFNIDKKILFLNSCFKTNRELLKTVHESKESMRNLLEIIRGKKEYIKCGDYINENIHDINIGVLIYENLTIDEQNKCKIKWLKIFAIMFLCFYISIFMTTNFILQLFEYYSFFDLIWTLILMVFTGLISTVIQYVMWIRKIRKNIFSRIYIKVLYNDKSINIFYPYTYILDKSNYKIGLIYSNIRILLLIYDYQFKKSNNFLRYVFSEVLLSEISNYVDCFFIYAIHILTEEKVFSNYKYIKRLGELVGQEQVIKTLRHFHKIHKGLEKNFQVYWEN